MNNYEIIVYRSSEDNAFIAEVPELAGCMADGQSYVEAVQNAEIVIAEWLETAALMGRPVPSARGKLVYAETKGVLIRRQDASPSIPIR